MPGNAGWAGADVLLTCLDTFSSFGIFGINCPFSPFLSFFLFLPTPLAVLSPNSECSRGFSSKFISLMPKDG